MVTGTGGLPVIRRGGGGTVEGLVSGEVEDAVQTLAVIDRVTP